MVVADPVGGYENAKAKKGQRRSPQRHKTPGGIIKAVDPKSAETPESGAPALGVDPVENLGLKIRGRGNSLELPCHLSELLRIPQHMSTAKALLGVTLHAEATGKVKPPFQVIFQFFLKLAAVHNPKLQVVLELAL